MPKQPTPEAQGDFKALLYQLMPLAAQTIDEYGEFQPLAAAVDAEGRVRERATHAADDSSSAENDSGDYVQALRHEARGGRIRAAGICYAGQIVHGGRKVRAVIVSMEHVCGAAAKACIPCLKDEQGTHRLGEVSVVMDEPKVFASSSGSQA